MRAVVMKERNKPWQLDEVPDPRPGPGQVLVQVEACGLCGTDVHMQRGAMPFAPVPVVPGHEPVGRVVELGAGVTDLTVGDRVGAAWVQKGCGRCAACQSHRFWNCTRPQSWMQLGGGFAQRMLAWAGGCTLVPEGLGAEEAAPLFCAGYTALSGLRRARPRADERVAVLGIGGLGHLGLQIAKAFHHEVVAVTGTESKAADARVLGADAVVIAGEHAGRSLKKAGGADVILATTSSARHVSQAVAGLRPGGRLVSVGTLDGAIEVQPFELMFPPRAVLGGTQGERADLVTLLALAAAGKLRPKIEVHELDQVNAALERLSQGKVRYRAVLRAAP